MISSVQRFSNLVALPHSVFALPFALAAFFLAISQTKSGVETELTGRLAPGIGTLLVVVLAVICARTAAMAFNRLVDERFDRLNPRTAGRELPQKLLTRRSVITLTVFCSSVFLVCAGVLGSHCLVLAPFVLLLLFFYSFSKRFTRYSHLFLGLALALAPGGAWWVLRPQVEVTPLLLMGAVLCWVAGFDILYSCQDREFDRANRLHSIPAKIGIARALKLAMVLHLVAFLLFMAVGVSSALALTYYIGIALLGCLLIGQHLLISPTSLARINHAFFTANGAISILYFLIVVFSLR